MTDSETFKNAGMDLAKGLLSQGASMGGDLLFKEIFGDPSKKVPEYFEEVLKRFEGIVAAAFDKALLNKMKDEVQGTTYFMSNDYYRLSMDPNTPAIAKHEKLNDYHVNFSQHVMSALTRQPALQIAGFELFVNAASVHLNILQEMAKTDPYNQDNPRQSSYVGTLSGFATQYAEHAEKAFEAKLTARLAQLNMSAHGSYVLFGDSGGQYSGRVDSREENAVNQAYWNFLARTRAAIITNAGDPMVNCVAHWRELALLPLGPDPTASFSTFPASQLGAINRQQAVSEICQNVKDNGLDLGTFQMKILPGMLEDVYMVGHDMSDGYFKPLPEQDGFKPLGHVFAKNHDLTGNFYVDSLMMFKPTDEDGLYQPSDFEVVARYHRDDFNNSPVLGTYSRPQSGAFQPNNSGVWFASGADEPDFQNCWLLNGAANLAVAVEKNGWGMNPGSTHETVLDYPIFPKTMAPLDTTQKVDFVRSTTAENAILLPQVVYANADAHAYPEGMRCKFSNLYPAKLDNIPSTRNLRTNFDGHTTFVAEQAPADRAPYGDTIYLYDRTRPELFSVVPVPFTAVRDRALSSMYVKSDWYFIINERCWEFIALPEPGSDEFVFFDFDFGVDQDALGAFTKATGVGISPEAGVYTGGMPAARETLFTEDVLSAIGPELLDEEFGDIFQPSKQSPMDYGPKGLKRSRLKYELGEGAAVVWRGINTISVLREDGSCIGSIDCFTSNFFCRGSVQFYG